MDTNYNINNVLKAAGLAIHGSASALAKTTVSVFFKILGTIYGPLAAADLPALTGINVADLFTVCVLVQVNAAGTVSYKQSEAIANVSGVILPNVSENFPPADEDKAVVGYLVIQNTSGAPFVGGTTHLDASGIGVGYIDAYGFVGV